MSIAGRRVLVTGGGSGAGADLALGFARAGAAEVVICGRRVAALEATAAQHPTIRALPCDVSDEASVQALFVQAGRVDIVIANVNLTGAFLTFREGLRQFDGWGRLVAVASTAGLKGYAKVAPYAAAKHGVVGMVRSLALEVARGPVTVNAICPGFLDTPMTDHSIQVVAEKTGRTLAEARAALEAMSPQNRLYRPDEVTAAALWVCGPGTDGVNGQAISISGGEA